jgi:alanyl-tRNA synthetase
MTSAEVRKRYLAFFEKRSHQIIPSASLVPENDATTLFTSSGMQPLVPYLLGEKHPAGTRLVNLQKCFRSEDINDVGDNRHTVFFEMMGNWSLGDYFKNEQLPWFFEFLTEEVKIDPKKLYVTAFIGDEKNGIPKDNESVEIWKELFKKAGVLNAKAVEIGSESNGAQVGMQGGRIFYYDAKKNWWSRSGTPDKMPPGEPGGPDSEVFYEFENIEHDPKFGDKCHVNCDCGRYLEIGNSVFMEYRKQADGSFAKLPQANVDFGGGFERIVAVSENKSDVFETDIFKPLIQLLETQSGKKYGDLAYQKSFRIVADHVRASVFLIADGTLPSNKDQGYFVRRLLRRAIFHLQKLKHMPVAVLVRNISDAYGHAYPELRTNLKKIEEQFTQEENKFVDVLSRGKKEFDILSQKGITTKYAFSLFSSYGLPPELIQEFAKEKGFEINQNEFEEEVKKHQELSRQGAEKKFKGGLADHSDKVVQYHTATHLLHKALREVLGDHVGQKGSNITGERLRFDFTHGQKMTDEEKKRVEDIVNAKIKEALPVNSVVLPREEAEKTGALHFFAEKYGEQIKIYFIGKDLASAYSKEYCGGPHVGNTNDLKGTFKIQKEEAVSAGVRRIKAVLA